MGLLGSKIKKFEVLDLKHIGRTEIDYVGVKAAYLGDMLGAKLPVPGGFVITRYAFEEFIKANKLNKPIEKLLKDLDIDDSKKLHTTSKELQKLILGAKISPKLIEQIERQYDELQRSTKSLQPVAVRGSVTVMTDENTNFPGQQVTFLNVLGAQAVIRSIQHVWASYYDSHAVYYRENHKLPHTSFQLAVVIQLMAEPTTAGVMYTANPVSGNPEEIIIEAAYGLGEVVVLGEVTPDRYVVAKTDNKIDDIEVHAQPWQIVKVAGDHAGNKHITIPKAKQRTQKLTDEQILAVAQVGMKVEKHFGEPQNVEWVVNREGEIFIVESWPLHSEKQTLVNPDASQELAATAKAVVRGVGGSAGLASGLVRIVHNLSDLDNLKKGEVLVAETTTPAYLTAMKRAAAVVVDTGGMTSHAVMIARELGIPCVVGTGSATSQLKNGVVVTIDGQAGVVYQGKVSRLATKQPQVLAAVNEQPIITGTKIMVNLANPEQAAKVAGLPVDGIGLMRAEFMFAGLGTHPRYLIKEGKEQKVVNQIVNGIREIAQSFSPRPVIYRASDFKTNEYRALKGGDKVEPREENPMLGFRGALRYLREPDLFKLELAALKTVRDSYDLRNVWLMIPFVRTVEELVAVRELVNESGLLGERDFKLWMMAEVPSNVIMIDQFLDMGIDGVSIGSNDLTQLILGVDRDNAKLTTEFDERHPAVLASMRHVVEACRRRHVSVSVCGQAVSHYPEVLEAMIAAGVTSVSVNADVALETRKLVASIERRLMLDVLTRTAHGAAHPFWK